MELNLEMKQQLEKLLAKPSLVTQEHTPLLKNLIEKFPYYQPLYLLLAKASVNNENQNAVFAKAATYNNGSILHTIIHEPQELSVIEELNIITYPIWQKKKANIGANLMTASSQKPDIEHADHYTISSTQATTSGHEQEQLTIVTEKQEEESTLSTENVSYLSEEDSIAVKETTVYKEIVLEDKELDEQEVFEEIGEIALLKLNVADEEILSNITTPEGYISEENAQTRSDALLATPSIESNEEFEIQEAPAENPSIIEKPGFTPIIETVEAPDQAHEVEKAKGISHEKTNEATPDELALESIVSADFFAFEKSFSPEILNEEEPTYVVEPSTVHRITFSIDKQDEKVVSKYDDDKLPFTFLWWLAKTRKDHEQIFRPFVSPIKQGSTQDLQHQYVEHIFHIQAPFVQTDEAGGEASLQPHTKGNDIINNFIKNEPQIKPLKPDQINNENKAKSSAEDNYDLVSETLAEVYIEQMLYHKAIDTYQKLSLKIPEKSRYFADLIQSLEKKI
ncbi:hypothetical protein [Pedobacter sp. ASV28]|uniref:hypothetical protein n=1 Tax=Pedobacter sp. ASV28 TaxID=2795123 RepID=UPI0018EDF35C|nr:hypothetical protein [Pedobacter sp. ASV28]